MPGNMVSVTVILPETFFTYGLTDLVTAPHEHGIALGYDGACYSTFA